jgi:hypothetical protein
MRRGALQSDDLVLYLELFLLEGVDRRIVRVRLLGFLGDLRFETGMAGLQRIQSLH